jgi:pantoate--beta-alanine ligase
MGYLHRGHLALMEEAKRRADQVVVSIFVNPKQFGAGEDLDKYPRDLEHDLRLCQDVGVDAVFTPEGSEMYPPGFQTRVVVEHLSQNLCGRYRPDFFPGVATVVTKLFCLVQPDVAVFGEKDYQQLVVVRQLSRDLHLEVEVVGHPTVREEDGLAMSSRNAYLSPDQRQSALSLSQSLLAARRMVAQGERRVPVLVERVQAMIEAKPHTKVQYAQVVDGDTMADLAEVTPRAVMALAVFVGKARLIDNMRLWPDAGEKGI